MAVSYEAAHDDGAFQAPQYDMGSRHDRVMAQSAHDGEIEGTRKWVADHPLVLPIAVITIGTTTFVLW